MDVQFADAKLRRLEQDPGYTGGYAREVVTAFRKRMHFIRSATDERDFRAMKSLHYEKLKGKRKHQRSMRLNRQYRLILELKRASSGKLVVIVSIEDYHR